MQTDSPIAGIMTAQVVTVSTRDKVSDVRRIMNERGIHHVPVVDDGILKGLVSYTDIAELSFTEFTDDERVRDAVLDERCTVSGLMRTNLVTLPPDASIRDAAERLSSGRFHSILVVDGDDTLVGVVTSTDLIRLLAE